MVLTKRSFGTIGEQEIFIYTLENSKGMKAEVTNFGAVLVKLLVPDANGQVADVVLGYDTLDEYKVNADFYGSTVGPSANRIGGAAFTLEGVAYKLAENDGTNNLHSDRDKGYHKVVWDVQEGDKGITFLLKDADGNLGFPGNKEIRVTYSLDEENALRIQYHGTSDKKTILNLTNHTYFNLDGHDSGSNGAHKMQIHASYFTPTSEDLIPTGELMAVKGTPMDFTQPKTIGEEIDADFAPLTCAGGYDHNWVIDGWDGTLREFAVVEGPVSGRKMVCYTTLPGVQFYAGNFMKPDPGKGGAVYDFRGAFCLETQYFPNSVNIPTFPSCIFGGDKEYISTTVYKFV